MSETFVRVLDTGGRVLYINTRYIRGFTEESDGTIALIEVGTDKKHYIQGPLSDFILALNYHDIKDATNE